MRTTSQRGLTARLFRACGHWAWSTGRIQESYGSGVARAKKAPLRPSLDFVGTLGKPVSDAADSLDINARRAKLLPQPFHVGIDRSSGHVGVDFPHVAEERVAGLDAVSSVVEREKKLELESRQLDLVTINPHAMSGTIDAEHAEQQHFAAPGLLGAGSAQDGLHAKQELAHAEGLYDVVVGAELETEHSVDFLALGRQHHDPDAA